jgi:hypothetical protein
LTDLRRALLSSLAALVMALVLALSGCNEGDDDDGGSGYTGTTVAPDQSENSATTTPPDVTDPGY